jgi:hypothetical protein
MIVKLATISVLYIFLVSVSCHQNHPNTFQQPPPSNQQHQQHQQQQQYQQQQQQQQHQQQRQEHHQERHDRSAPGDAMMNNINRDHVLEHLDGVINKPKEQMTVDEQNFYYFKLHDYDNNNMVLKLSQIVLFL